jgi:hypothetical protein
MRAIACLLLAVAVAGGQTKYKGPRPQESDVPYLLHAANLIPLEKSEAKEEKRKDDAIAYVVTGAASPVKTPLASPIFLLQSEKILPEQLELYRVDANKASQREVVFSKRKQQDNPRSFRLSLARMDGNLYRLEVVESLPNGEYCVTPKESNQVFCFQVY